MADDGPNLDDAEIDSLVEEANEQAGVTPEQRVTAPDEVAQPAASEGESESESTETASAEDAQATDPVERTSETTEALLQEAESELERVLANDFDESDESPELAAAGGSPFEFQDFGGSRSGNAAMMPIENLDDVELDLRIELGRTELLIEDVVKLAEGSIVQLDKLAGDPVDILINGRLIARGEVLVLNDNFCVRVVEILTPEV